MPPSFDEEWAESLVGLRMQIANAWWPDYRGDMTLNPGYVVSIDLSKGEKIFQVKLDEDLADEEPWSLHYDAVLTYADEEHPGYHRFHLPMEAPSAPECEVVHVRRRGAPRRLNADALFDDEEDAAVSEEEEVIGPLEDGEGAEEEDADVAIYERTASKDWRHVKGKNVNPRTGLRNIDPIPFDGDSEEFDVNISDEELAELIDDEGDIRWPRVFEWLLPRYSNDSFFQFIAARMRNYMVHIQRTQAYRPYYYKPDDELFITGDHVARFFGCHIVRMVRGFPSILVTWSTRESLGAVGAVKESMPKDAYLDIHRCMHFSDDWDVEEGVEWDRVYPDPKVEPSPEVARHRRKFEYIEDGFNERWKECVVFGKWVTADESRVAGWYNSVITLGPEPKPIRTGATIHSLCVTLGALASYKLHCRVYGGKTDEDLCKKHVNTANTQKWINLYDELLDSFKGECFGFALSVSSISHPSISRRHRLQATDTASRWTRPTWETSWPRSAASSGSSTRSERRSPTAPARTSPPSRMR